MPDSEPDSTQAGAPCEPHPERRIGIWTGVALYVCAILGAGVLVLPGQVASIAGPASLLAWAFSILLSIPLAFTFATLATTYPDAGGVATFARHAFGATAGGIGGWWYFLAGSVGQAIVPLTAGYYIADALGVSQRMAPAFAAVILGVAVLTALIGLRFGGTVQIILAIGVAAVLVLAIVAALPAIRWEAFTPFAPHGVAGIGVAVVVLFYAFSGWEAIAHLAGDFRNVRRDLPRATSLTLFIVAVLYLGVAFAVVGTHSYGDTELDNVALARVVGDQLGVSPAIAVAVAATVICLGTTNAFMASVSRLGYALGRDGWAPRRLERVNRRGAPATSVIAVGAIGGAGLAGCALFGWGTSDLVYIPSTLVLATYLLATAAGTTLMAGRRRLVPATAFILIAVITPSAGWYLVIPLGIALAVLALARFRSPLSAGTTPRSHRAPRRTPTARRER